MRKFDVEYTLVNLDSKNVYKIPSTLENNVLNVMFEDNTVERFDLVKKSFTRHSDEYMLYVDFNTKSGYIKFNHIDFDIAIELTKSSFIVADTIELRFVYFLDEQLFDFKISMVLKEVA